MGAEGVALASLGRRLILDPEWILHVLGELCRSHRSHHLHLTWPSSPRRLCTLLVRNVSRQLGKFAEFQFVAMDSDPFDGWHVPRDGSADGGPLRLLRGLRMHFEPILHHVQPHPLRYHHRSLRLTRHPGVKPSLRTSTKQHGGGLLHVPHHVGSREPQACIVQPAPGQ